MKTRVDIPAMEIPMIELARVSLRIRSCARVSSCDFIRAGFPSFSIHESWARGNGIVYGADQEAILQAYASLFLLSLRRMCRSDQIKTTYKDGFMIL
jgi:hypothetical protein